jgi:Hint domain
MLGGGGNTIVNYYFSVDTSNLITGFYNYNNIGVNVLQVNALPYPIGQPPLRSINPVSNIFVISTRLFDNNNGVNFIDTSLQAILQTNTPYFNIYNSRNLPYVFWSYIINQTGNNTDDSKDLSTDYINIQSISGPPSPVPCFLEGSKILTDKGYKPIQDLRKGDLVKTLKHDFKPIDMIGKRDMCHPGIKERIKDQLYKCSQPQYLEIFEPLVITGCHCILVDDFKSEEQKQKVIEVNGKIYVTDNKYRLPACADPRASIYETHGTYTIYHLALENDNYYMNYGIYANGLLVETCSKRYLKELSNMTLLE